MCVCVCVCVCEGGGAVGGKGGEGDHCVCRSGGGLLLFVACLTPQQHASVPQGRFCSDNYCKCCHTEIEVADQSTSPSYIC